MSGESDTKTDMGKRAFVLGFTGESGKVLVKELLQCDVIKKLVLIGRREVTLEHTDYRIEQKVIDFEKVEEYKDVFEGCDVGYCCLGTTRGKSGKEGFIKVDHDYIVNSARVAKEAGCSHFNLLSSQGADKNSWFLYTKVKGQVEAEVEAMNFDRLSIYRPSVLMVDRVESRPGEAVFRAILKPITAISPGFMSCPVTVLAKAMLNNMLKDSENKVELFSNSELFKLAGTSK